MKRYRILMAPGLAARADLEYSMNMLAHEGWTVTAIGPGVMGLPLIIIMESASSEELDLDDVSPAEIDLGSSGDTRVLDSSDRA